MKNVIEILKNYYKPVENAKRGQSFFFSLKDYVEHIKTTPELERIIKKITKDKKELLKKWNEYEAESLKELENAKKKLLKIVKQNRISNPELNESIKELNWYEKGKILSNSIKSDYTEHLLWEIAKNIFQTKHKKLLKEFIDEKPIYPNVYIDNKSFVLSKTIRKRRDIEEQIAKLRDTELWGCWDYLNIVPIVLLEERKFHEIVSKKDLGIADIFIELKEIFKIRREVKDRVNIVSAPHIPQAPSDEDYEIQKYKLYASRIHNHLLEELNSQIVKIPTLIQPSRIEPNMTAEAVEFNRKIAEAGRWQAERDQKDKQHRELMKQNRILAALATKTDKYSHALDLIIEQTEYNGDGSNFSIDYYYFNFENRMVDSRMLEKFLTEMQDNGCFEKYTRTNYAGGVRFGFTKANIKNLKKFKEKRGVKFVNRDNEQITEVENLLDKLESDIKKEMKSKAKYENGILYFRNKEIDFRNKQNQKDLLATLFEDPKKNWYYDEIQGIWDERWEDVKRTNPKAKDYWKKFYSAGDGISQAVAIETQVKDFIIKNTKEIRINPDYV